jgi:hypothetical protein
MQQHSLYFDGPGRYLILIKGHLSQEMLAIFPAKVVHDGIIMLDNMGYRLIIDFRDQSELMSALNILYNHHCTILKVEYLSKDPGLS